MDRLHDRTSPNESAQADDHSLPEFEQFLESIGYGDLYRWRKTQDEPCELRFEDEAPASPSASADSCSPPTRGNSNGSKRAGRGWLALAAAVLMFCLLCAELMLEMPALTAAQAALSLPAFSVMEFRSLWPGMSGTEVRNRLGLPDARRILDVTSGRQEWVYLMPIEDASGCLRVYTVSLEGDLVARADERLAPLQSDAELSQVWEARGRSSLPIPIGNAAGGGDGQGMLASEWLATLPQTPPVSAATPAGRILLQSYQADLAWLLHRLYGRS